MKTENGAATEYVYNALNQLVSDSETTYEYDLNGNLIRVIGTAGSALYEYNSENKLVKAIVQNGILVTEESYTYDYAGNRTSKTTYKSNSEFEYTKYLNDNSSLTNVLAEIDENGTAKCVYTIGADLVSQERDGRTSCYLYDGHGSVVGLANESGVVTDTYSYDAFGNLLKSTGSAQNCYRYCGEQFDESTGLYYLRARYMDTTTGRFISQDSYQGSINDPVSLHKYLYANANPVTYSDPSGYMVEGLIFAIEFIKANAVVIAVFSGLLAMLTMEVAYINQYHESLIMKLLSDLIDLGIESLDNAAEWIKENVVENEYVSFSKNYNPDPYARPGQKKQGRERKEKKKGGGNWNPRNNRRNEKPPKHHTPGKDHQKYPQNRIIIIENLYERFEQFIDELYDSDDERRD